MINLVSCFGPRERFLRGCTEEWDVLHVAQPIGQDPAMLRKFNITFTKNMFTKSTSTMKQEKRRFDQLLIILALFVQDRERCSVLRMYDGLGNNLDLEEVWSNNLANDDVQQERAVVLVCKVKY